MVLWLGTNPRRAGLEKLTPDVSKHIVIDSEQDDRADVYIQTPGLDPRLDAHIVRGDGVMLHLAGGNPALTDPMVSILQSIHAQIGDRP